MYIELSLPRECFLVVSFTLEDLVHIVRAVTLERPPHRMPGTLACLAGNEVAGIEG